MDHEKSDQPPAYAPEAPQAPPQPQAPPPPPPPPQHQSPYLQPQQPHPNTTASSPQTITTQPTTTVNNHVTMPAVQQPPPAIIVQPPAQTAQPAPATTTVMMGNQMMGGAMGAPQAAPQNVRDWDSGICGCFDDMPSCCMGLFCTWCLVCDINKDMQDHCCIACFQPELALFGSRIRMRTMYGIKGTMLQDCVCTMCCPMCTACQIKRQFKKWNFKGNNNNMNMMGMQQSMIAVTK